MKKSSLYVATVLFFAFVANTEAAKKFVFCVESNIKYFNPSLPPDYTNIIVSSQMYNRLVQFDNSSNKILPSLATRWEISKDQKQYTFYLRKDVKFHTTKYFQPSRGMNADDILFSYQRILDKKHPFHKISGGNYPNFFSENLPEKIAKIEKINDYTVRFQLKEAYSPLLFSFASRTHAIMSQEYATQLTKKKQKDHIDSKPVGTGPFLYKSYRSGEFFKLAKNPNYFETPAAVDTVIVTTTPDSTVRVQKLKRNECQQISNPNPQDFQAIRKHESTELVEKIGGNIGYLAMNLTKKPFDNKLIRKAINHALNRRAYIDAIYFNKAKVAHTAVPFKSWASNQSIAGYGYNPELAKKLLKQAGFPKGFKTSLYTIPINRPYIPNGTKLGTLIQADLKKVGIEVKLITMEWATYIKKVLGGEHEMALLGWMVGSSNPNTMLSSLLSCTAAKSGMNIARWCNPKFEKYLGLARKAANRKDQRKYYKLAQEVAHKEAPWVPLAHGAYFSALRKNLKQGIYLSDYGEMRFETIKY